MGCGHALAPVDRRSRGLRLRARAARLRSATRRNGCAGRGESAAGDRDVHAALAGEHSHRRSHEARTVATAEHARHDGDARRRLEAPVRRRRRRLVRVRARHRGPALPARDRRAAARHDLRSRRHHAQARRALRRADRSQAGPAEHPGHAPVHSAVADRPEGRAALHGDLVALADPPQRLVVPPVLVQRAGTRRSDGPARDRAPRRDLLRALRQPDGELRLPRCLRTEQRAADRWGLDIDRHARPDPAVDGRLHARDGRGSRREGAPRRARSGLVRAVLLGGLRVPQSRVHRPDRLPARLLGLPHRRRR